MFNLFDKIHYCLVTNHSFYQFSIKRPILYEKSFVNGELFFNEVFFFEGGGSGVGGRAIILICRDFDKILKHFLRNILLKKILLIFAETVKNYFENTYSEIINELNCSQF